MAEDKKTDDYTIEMNRLDQESKAFEPAPSPQPRSNHASNSVANNPILPVLAYCGSSILMTVMNKYVLSGLDFNLNFLLLCVQVGFDMVYCCIEDTCADLKPFFFLLQSVVCILTIQSCKSAGLITYRNFSADEARKCMLILLFVVGYCSSSLWC